MFKTEQEFRHEALLEVARRVMTAARTAPKACGFDNLQIAMVDGEELQAIAQKMREMASRPKRAFFTRDADNLEQSEVAVLIGTVSKNQGLDCGYCGYATCAAKQEANPAIPCVYNTHDLGLAIGSAVSVAADCRTDNRVMYSVGAAAMELGMMPDCNIVMAVPLAAMGKSPFFDRKIASCAR